MHRNSVEAVNLSQGWGRIAGWVCEEFHIGFSDSWGMVLFVMQRQISRYR